MREASKGEGSGAWLNSQNVDTRLLSFLAGSPLRTPPKQLPDGPWFGQVRPALVVQSLVPYCWGLTLAYSLPAGAALLVGAAPYHTSRVVESGVGSAPWVVR